MQIPTSMLVRKTADSYELGKLPTLATIVGIIATAGNFIINVGVHMKLWT